MSQLDVVAVLHPTTGDPQLHPTIRERTRRLIAIAHPRFHDELERAARAMGYLA